jgi:hypothetical protein
MLESVSERKAQYENVKGSEKIGTLHHFHTGMQRFYRKEFKTFEGRGYCCKYKECRNGTINQI